MLAGKIAREAREFGASHVSAGGSSLELANAIEALIVSRGGECAFPVNIGVNQVAAHYTPSKTDDLRFRIGDLVKIDVGAHVDGYPADTSATVEVGTRNHTKLIQCAEDALRMCIDMVAPGTSVAAMGETVARTIGAAGFKPIENLTGHSMERFNLHAGLSIPNIATRDRGTVSEGMILAIEPFSTTGQGKVKNSGRGNIYRVVQGAQDLPGRVRPVREDTGEVRHVPVRWQMVRRPAPGRSEPVAEAAPAGHGHELPGADRDRRRYSRSGGALGRRHEERVPDPHVRAAFS